MDLHLKGKRAIVTGASRGIGFAVAERLVEEGASVTLVARGQEALDQAARTLAEHGATVIGIAADISLGDAVRAMVDNAAESMGGIDILVNCAARRGVATANDDPAAVEAELRSDVETKVLGYLRCARAVTPFMVAQGWGRIVNVGGSGARRTGNPVVSMRNAAVAALTKNLADELGSLGINVTVVHPGATLTDDVANDPDSRRRVEARAAAIGQHRVVSAREVADVITFLASPRSVALHGDPIMATGGLAGPIFY